MKCLALALCLIGGQALAGPPPPPDDLVGAGDTPGVEAVQNRQQFRKHEFTAWVGALPLDAFTKGITFTGAYTARFTDLVSWEVAQFTYSVGVDTRLRSELDALAVGPTPFETTRFYLTSNVLFTPFYGKSAVLNRGMVKHEGFVLVGAGVGWLTLTTRPAVSFGGGWRFFAGDHVSFRLDVRDTMFIAAGDVQNELWLGLGVSIGVGR